MTAVKATKTAKTAKTPKIIGPDKSARYTTRINHVGALLPDTKAMLAHWDLDADVPTNLKRMRAENVFAKTSRSIGPTCIWMKATPT